MATYSLKLYHPNIQFDYFDEIKIISMSTMLEYFLATTSTEVCYELLQEVIDLNVPPENYCKKKINGVWIDGSEVFLECESFIQDVLADDENLGNIQTMMNINGFANVSEPIICNRNLVYGVTYEPQQIGSIQI